jgi:formiminoglutamase
MKKLPVLLSIPHGGTEIPGELKNNVCITPHDLFDDGDAFTREIYRPAMPAVSVLAAGIARAFVDLNRSVVDLPPKNPDGLIKSMTCYKKPIYIPGKEPDEYLRKTLIDRYYLPYHRKIREVVDSGKAVLALDCHSMAAHPPPIAPDRGGLPKRERPAVCLGNAYGKSSDMHVMTKLARCFCRAFSLERHEVTFNEPFSGGYITRAYGMNPIPWVQVELNRSLYLSPPWFDHPALEMDPRRLEELNRMFETALRLYFDME